MGLLSPLSLPSVPDPLPLPSSPAYLTGAFLADSLTTNFFTASFIVVGVFVLAALAVQAFLRFATSHAFAAAESLRLGFHASGRTTSAMTLDAAHFFRYASAIALPQAAVTFRPLRSWVPAWRRIRHGYTEAWSGVLRSLPSSGPSELRGRPWRR